MLETLPGEVVGTSDGAQRMRAFVARAARGADPVLLEGEPGTGKQATARLIHESSPRGKAPLLMVDCSLYYERELKRELFGYAANGPSKKAKKGLLEFGSKGTCYLARIEELTPALQASLLEVVRAGRFCRLGDGKLTTTDVRLIVSSEKNLSGFVEAGLFDGELFRLLGAHRLEIPALRQRSQDVQAFVELALASAQPGPARTMFSAEAVQALQAYPWPNNLDDLFKEVERLARAGVSPVRPENLALEISSYWLGRNGDPEIRAVLEELDAHLKEFLVMSRLDLDYAELLGWTSPAATTLAATPRRDVTEEL